MQELSCQPVLKQNLDSSRGGLKLRAEVEFETEGPLAYDVADPKGLTENLQRNPSEGSHTTSNQLSDRNNVSLTRLH